MKRFALAIGSMVLGAAVVAPSADAATVYAITDNNNQEILSFQHNTPSQLSSRVFIQGLLANEQLLGIDVHPGNRQIYGVGSAGNLYQVNYQSGVARLIAPLTDSVTGQPVPLGGFYGMDFNPAANAIRLINDSGQNLAITVDTNPGRTTVQTSVTFADGIGTPRITGSAYSNVTPGPLTLWGVDRLLHQLVSTTGFAGGVYTKGPLLLGATTTELQGFDIELGTGLAYGAFKPTPLATSSSFFGIDLATGAVTPFGMISDQEEPLIISGMTLGPAVVPEPGALMLLSLGGVALLGRRRRK